MDNHPFFDPSRDNEVMWTIFGSYDHLMIVYLVYVFYDQWQWPFCLVAIKNFNLGNL